MTNKINFKQPKYIFPLVLLLPIVFLAYTVSGFFNSDGHNAIPAEGLNMSVPDADTDDILTKYDAMSRRFAKDDDAYTALGDIGKDESGLETLEDNYTEEEKDNIDRMNAERLRQEEALREMQESFSKSRERVQRSSSYATQSTPDSEQEEYAQQYQQMQQLAIARQKMMQQMMGVDTETPKEEPVKQPVKVEPPSLVLKSKAANADKFTTITDAAGNSDESLIKAMIDKTTKAHEGTRLRFKLLDDVTIEDVKLKKGTYLYGVVVGFGQQRVMAEISSIMVGNRFLKVSLAVFDNDGMEGFYVPESAFRDFMKNAGASAVQSNMNFTSNGGYGNEITGEFVALQALQNIYNAGTSALSANMRKNRAKIKYNTIVYLINSKNAQ
ncbi:conjugative transposon protein TraM [Duncaniella muris]|uniref:conjugative transposon protein TraM n=1 Tax=Duncaniella muris TaxID=2094150 RepID=UPI00263B2460|nr:conjugative transposon protein TraM [Duncaniella muris]